MIYRVKTETTTSKQPGAGNTFWQTEVLYCGPDIEEARIAYHQSQPTDYGGSYGNAARRTLFERLDTAELDDDEPGESWVEVSA